MLVEESERSELVDAHAISQPLNYLEALWARRHYVGYVATNELKSRHMTSLLGNVWHLLNPLLQIGVYFLIFGVLLGTDRGVENFILFITVGIFVFGFTQKVTMAGATSIVGNRGLLSQISFPRALLPITSVAAEALAMLPPLAVIYFVAIVSGSTPSLTWVVLPALIGVQTIFNCGLAMLAARATHLLRDMQQILPFVFRLLFYASGIIFSIDAYAEGSRFKWLFYANPLSSFVSLSRWTVMDTRISGYHILSASVWTVVVVVVGFFWFRKGEHTYGRD